MEGDAGVYQAEVKQAIRKAFVLQRYLLRRAWGILYAASSVSIFLAVFGQLLVDLMGIPRDFADLASLTMSMAASGSAFIAILWTFKRVRNTAEIHEINSGRRWAEFLGWRFLVPMWVAINAIMIFSITFFRQHAPLVLLLIYLGLALFLYYALTQSFPEGIPFEGIISISSFSFSTIVSIALMALSVRDSVPFVIIWISTIFLWIISGAYARSLPIPKLKETNAV